MSGIELPGQQAAQAVDIASDRIFYTFAWALQPPQPGANGNMVSKLMFVTPQGEAFSFLLDSIALARFRRDVAAAPDAP